MTQLNTGSLVDEDLFRNQVDQFLTVNGNPRKPMGDNNMGPYASLGGGVDDHKQMYLRN